MPLPIYGFIAMATVYVVLATIAVAIASRKGYPFLVSLLLAVGLTPIIGLIVAIFLPDNSPKRTLPPLEDVLIDAIIRKERERRSQSA